MLKTPTLECLCPHCLTTTALPESSNNNQNASIRLRCKTCFSQFEAIIADGKEDTKNVIVIE
ncbi:hypothetical protein [Aliiglaciecola litoralis]|uniref:MJ0042 family finger-like domain-containing protein n=1 Tax=Aliiglaciecola litoralis TaxID=582857 RepID=A0ABN1LSI3_9ALTE